MRSDRKNDGDTDAGPTHGEGSVFETQIYKRAKGAAVHLGENTSMQFKLVLPIAAILIAGTWKFSSAIAQAQNRLSVTWTINHAEAFAKQLKRDNPTLNVPDARDIFESKPNKPIELMP